MKIIPFFDMTWSDEFKQVSLSQQSLLPKVTGIDIMSV